MKARSGSASAPFIPRGILTLGPEDHVLLPGSLSEGERITFARSRPGWELTYHDALIESADADATCVVVGPSTVVTWSRADG